MYLSRELTLKSTNEIGAAFGRNHATILSAEKRIKELCEKDENIRRSVSQLRHEIKKGS
jgi:chromosomal replication initiator protein